MCWAGRLLGLRLGREGEPFAVWSWGAMHALALALICRSDPNVTMISYGGDGIFLSRECCRAVQLQQAKLESGCLGCELAPPECVQVVVPVLKGMMCPCTYGCFMPYYLLDSW
jgi:hypothetical protein